MKNILLAALLPCLMHGQSDLETVIRGGEILLTSLTAFKMAKSDPYAKSIENVCVRNKLDEKITFILTGKDEEGEEVKKEIIVAKGGKECMLNIQKGIYTYEVLLTDETVYKKYNYELYAMPGIGYVQYHFAGQDSLGHYSGMFVEYLIWAKSHQNNEFGPSHVKIYTRFNLNKSSRSEMSRMYMYSAGVQLSIEKRVNKTEK